MFRIPLKLSIPVALGYVSLGSAFGVLMLTHGYPWWAAPLMGVVIYAGAAQFFVIAILTSSTVSLPDAFFATFSLNMRHIFYGASVINVYSKLSIGRRIYSIFSLTDETFALVSTLDLADKDPNMIFKLSLINHLWWVAGCGIGSLIGSIEVINAKGLEFSLSALFLILLTDVSMRHKTFLPIICAVLGCVFASKAFSPEWFLTGAILAGAAISLAIKQVAK